MSRYVISVVSIALLVIMNSCDSREIMSAFETVNKSIIDSNDSLNSVVIGRYDSILQHKEFYRNRISQVTELQYLSNQTYSYLDSTITVVIQNAGGKDSFEKKMTYGDNNVSTNYFITNGNGKILQERLLNYYSGLEEIAPAQVDSLKNAMTDLKSVEFNKLHFHDVPLIGVVIVLNKYKNDVKNNELRILDNFSRQKAVR